MEQVILVDTNDEYLGTMEKMEAHQKALLHRAFSVFIFNGAGEMLLQQRALDKYHSGGLWTNSCCSHPRPEEETHAAAIRRLQEEMGFTTSLEKAFDFVYQAPFGNGLTEYEFDHVFVGYAEETGQPNPLEVAMAEFRSPAVIEQQMQQNPENFTVWFRIAFPKVMEWWQQKQMHAA
jgi:isopentenyl-diphosphate delta-isomerase